MNVKDIDPNLLAEAHANVLERQRQERAERVRDIAMRLLLIRESRTDMLTDEEVRYEGARAVVRAHSFIHAIDKAIEDENRPPRRLVP